jgi:hypothetical protein
VVARAGRGRGRTPVRDCGRRRNTLGDLPVMGDGTSVDKVGLALKGAEPAPWFHPSRSAAGTLPPGLHPRNLSPRWPFIEVRRAAPGSTLSVPADEEEGVRVWWTRKVFDS